MKSKSFIQFIKFCMVGVINTLVSYSVYSLLFHFGVQPLICNIPAFIISVLVSFLLNNKFVFKQNQSSEHRKWWQTLLKTYVSYSFTGLFLAEALTTLWMHIIVIEHYLGFMIPYTTRIGLELTEHEIAGYLVPVFNLVVSIPINFILNKFWAFRQKSNNSVNK